MLFGFPNGVNPFSSEDLRHFAQEECHAPLHLAVSCGQVACIEALVRLGADVNGRDFFRETPLHIAARIGDAAYLNVLLAAGADLTVLDPQSRTAVKVALWMKDPSRVIGLHAKGAYFNLKRGTERSTTQVRPEVPHRARERHQQQSKARLDRGVRARRHAGSGWK